MCQKHGLITGSSAHLKHLLMSGQLQELEVARVDRWLGDRLAIADRERGILVGAVAHTRGHEEMPWRRLDGSKHREVADATLPQRVDQTSAGSAKQMRR